MGREKIKVYVFKTNELDLFKKAREIRDTVFVEEQNVPLEAEFDAFEGESTHYLLELEGKAIGTARWRIKDDSIKLERFGIYKSYRNQGLGEVLLKRILEDIINLEKPIFLHSQLKAIPFYQRAGFAIVGEQFTECDIEHFRMEF